MSQVFGYLLLALCLFVAYQGYENSRSEAALSMAEHDAQSVACEIDPSCVLTREQPRVIKADVFRRRYEFQTSTGPVVVTCDRRYIWLGEWSCSAAPGQL